MYSLRNLLDKEPVAIAEVVRQGIAVLVAFAVVQWTDQQIVIVYGFVSVFLMLFVRAKSTPTAQVKEDLDALQQAVDEAAAPAKPARKRGEA